MRRHGEDYEDVILRGKVIVQAVANVVGFL